MVNLQKADLEGADLRDADLRGADLYGANLRGAHLGGANLQGVDLLGANMEGARLRGTIMTGEDLDGAKLQGANLRGAKLKKAKSREWEKKSDEDAGLRYLLRKQLREEDEGLDYFWILYFLVATPLAALSLTAWTEHWQWGIESYAPFVKIGLDYFESQIQGQTITPVLGGIENLTGLGWPGWLADFLGFYLLIGGAMWLWRRRMMDIPSEPNMWTFLGGHLGNTGMNLISVISWPITMVAGLAGLGKRWERRAVRSLMVLVLAFFLFAILAAMSLVQ